jgi:hypothetical protein
MGYFVSSRKKDAIISGTCSRGVELSHAKIPVKAVPDVMKTPIKNTCSVAFTNGTDAMPPEESITANSADSHDCQNVNANFLASEPRENEDTLLNNLAKHRLPASDIRSTLSQSIKQDAAPNINHTGYTANFTEVPPASKTSWQCSPFWPCIRLIAILILVLSFLFGPTTSTRPSAILLTDTLRVSVSAHDHSKTIQGALINRGANGGIAGNNVRIISVSD